MKQRKLYFILLLQFVITFSLPAQHKASLTLTTLPDKEFMYWFSGTEYLSDYEQGFARSTAAKTDRTGLFFMEFSIGKSVTLNIAKMNQTIMTVLPLHFTPGSRDTVAISEECITFRGTNADYNRCLQKTEQYLDYCNQLIIRKPGNDLLLQTNSLPEFIKLLDGKKTEAEKKIKGSGLEAAFVDEQLTHLDLGSRLAFMYKILFYVPDSLQTADWKKALENWMDKSVDTPYFSSFREVSFLLDALLALDYKLENGNLENIRKASFDSFERLAKYLNGKNLEYAWASLINEDICYKTYDPIVPELYDLLKERFPGNTYQSFLEAGIEENHRFNAAMIADASDSDYHILPCDSSFHSLADAMKSLKGKVIYVDLWATWCGSCLNEFPYLPRIKEKVKDLGIAFLYISTDKPENKERWEKSIRHYKLKGYHLLASPALSKAIYKEFGNYIPHYLIIDKAGNIVERNAPALKQTDTLYEKLARWSK